MNDRLFGVATAAVQVEGGIEGIDWELFTRDPDIDRRVGALLRLGGQPQPGRLEPPGDAVRHGDLRVLEADLDRARLLGANAYRFSVEWARLEPEPGVWRQDVLEGYYLRVIEALKARAMEPVVTLQHLSLPAWVLTPPSRTRWIGPLPFASAADTGFRRSLQGWESTATVEAFASYVERLAPALASAGVRWWIPINEPTGSVVGLGYIGGIWPPGFTVDGRRALAAELNLARAHVRAHDVIKDVAPTAMVGTAHASTPFRSLHRGGPLGALDAAATRQADYFFNLHFLDSLCSGRVDVACSLARPRWVPAADFFQTGAADWRSRLDFIGVNYYRPFTIRWHPLIAAGAARAGGLLSTGVAPVASDAGTKVEPAGLGEVIRRLDRRYGLPLLVTENGIAESSDRIRAPHLVAHLESVEASDAGGPRMLGYLYWSIVDNWEWDSGYEPTSRNGLLSVDFDDPDQPRALTEAGVAFRGVARGMSLREARDRYGSIAPDGSTVAMPTRAAGSLWRRSDHAGEWLAYLTASTRPAEGLLFDPGPGRWRELAPGEWERFDQGWRRDWRDGTWATEGEERPFEALRISALGRWEKAGADDRWLARTHDGTTWRRCACQVAGARVRLLTEPPLELELAGELLAPVGASWRLRRLPD